MWKVGQTVWDSVLGEGLVVEYTPNGYGFPVRARFAVAAGETYTRQYTEDGRGNRNWNRSLFFSEPKVEGATEPPFVPLLKKGDKVITIHKEHPGHSSGGKVATFGTVHQEFEKNVVLSNNGLVSFNKEHYLIYKIGEQVY